MTNILKTLSNFFNHSSMAKQEMVSSSIEDILGSNLSTVHFQITLNTKDSLSLRNDIAKLVYSKLAISPIEIN